MAKTTTKRKTAPTKKSPSKKPRNTKAAVSKKTTSKLSIVKDITLENLNKWNFGLAGLHFAQGVLIIILAKASSLPVTTTYLTNDTLAAKAAGHPVLVDGTRHLLDINLAYLVAIFFFMSAIAHIVVATVWRKNYETDLKKGINRARWYEYMLSASTMMVAIAMLSGVYDLSSLFMIFMLTAVMSLLGLMMEVHNLSTKKTNWMSFVIGVKAGIVPWIVFVIYIWGSNVYGSGQIPGFVYWIYASMFILFSSFAVNMYLQYKKQGKWANYLYGERTYMILSLVAKSALAWQIFFGTLRP